MTDEQKAFETFMKKREAAAQAFVSGDAKPLAQLTAKSGSATFFGPRGGHVEGADAVWSRYENDATSFQSGSESHFEILHMAADGGVAYWVGLQHAKARLKGRDEPVPMKLRVTEVFRRVGSEWKMVHRHADMLADEAK